MKKIFFMHVPKCGGTSVKKAFVENFKSNRIFNIDAHASKYVVDNFTGDDLQYFRDKLVVYAMATDKYDLIMGHTVFNKLLIENPFNKYSLVSLVRDPVSRFLSHYFYNRYKESTHYKIDDSFESFINSKAAKNMSSYYLKYFSGMDGRPSLDKARVNVSKFDVVGVLENLESFSNMISERLGIRFDIGHDNKNPVEDDDDRRKLSTAQMSEIQSICHEDIQIYKHICEVFQP